MRFTVDTLKKVLILETGEESRVLDLYSKEAFEIISRQWLKTGWNEKYTYTFTWMGRPIIQMPEDMVRLQEAIYGIKPDVIIETGVAHGGSLIFYASLCKAMDRGRVIGVDIEIRPHNRKAIETHELFPRITLIEGSSTSVDVVNQVKNLVRPGETVLVILDSNHTKSHVLAELEAYAGLVTAGSYIVVCDGVMKDLYDVPRGNPGWSGDNPVAAVKEFLGSHKEFLLRQPEWFFNESELDEAVTYLPDAWLRRV